jgi:two-component system, cell cycle response regulator CpdR
MARILLAEDDAAMLDLVKHTLVGDGHTVVTAQDGQEALELLSMDNAAFDVMLTDIQMPSLDGISLATQAVALMPKLKIVLMSAFADQFAVPDAVRPNVTHVLNKPLALEKVRSAVRSG